MKVEGRDEESASVWQAQIPFHRQFGSHNVFFMKHPEPNKRIHHFLRAAAWLYKPSP